MILYAMSDYLAKTQYNAQAAKQLTVSVNGGPAQVVKFADQLTRKLVIPGDRLKAGKNTLTVRLHNPHHFGGIFRRPFLYRPAG